MNLRRKLAVPSPPLIATALTVALAGGAAPGSAWADRGHGGHTPGTVDQPYGARVDNTGRGPMVRPLVPETPSVPTRFGRVICYRDGDPQRTYEPNPRKPAPGPCTRLFVMRASQFQQQISNFPLKVASVWGYDKSTPGPSIIAYRGENVAFKVVNALPEPTSVHFHGLHQPNDADGVSGISQPDPVQPGDSFVYRFTPGHIGTFAYHSHFDTAVQDMRGLDGAFLVLPRRQHRSSRPDVDVMFTLQEFEWESEGALVKPFGNMGNFGWRTINGRTGDASGGTIDIRRGDVVRIRLYNASNSVHTMHLHGHDEILISKNGHRVRPVRETSQSVGPGDFVEIEFKANNPGNWIFHCHFPHHTSNKMNAGYNGAPVGMTRIFHYRGYRRVSPKYFSDAHFKSESISK